MLVILLIMSVFISSTNPMLRRMMGPGRGIAAVLHELGPGFARYATTTYNPPFDIGNPIMYKVLQACYHAEGITLLPLDAKKLQPISPLQLSEIVGTGEILKASIDEDDNGKTSTMTLIVADYDERKIYRESKIIILFVKK